jgi:hypothetical protein
MSDKKKQKKNEFLDESVENDEEYVEYLDDEYEEDNTSSEATN